jgi:AcrR family transcriptional regulator
MDLETARARLLDTADRLFNERGVQGVGMDDIRSRSGVSLKRLYQAFPAKEQLVEAVLRRRDESVRAALTAYIGTSAAPEERILAVFDYLDEWFREPDFRGCAFINSFGELGGTSDRVAGVVRDNKLGLRFLFAELVEAAGLPTDLADQLAILANGAMASAGIFGSPEPAHQAKAAARTLIEASKRK